MYRNVWICIDYSGGLTCFHQPKPGWKKTNCENLRLQKYDPTVRLPNHRDRKLHQKGMIIPSRENTTGTSVVSCRLVSLPAPLGPSMAPAPEFARSTGS